MTGDERWSGVPSVSLVPARKGTGIWLRQGDGGRSAMRADRSFRNGRKADVVRGAEDGVVQPTDLIVKAEDKTGLG